MQIKQALLISYCWALPSVYKCHLSAMAGEVLWLWASCQASACHCWRSTDSLPERAIFSSAQLFCGRNKSAVVRTASFFSTNGRKAGESWGMVPVPEGGVDCRVYLLLEAAVWKAEGRFRKFPEWPKTFSKSKIQKKKKCNGIKNEQCSVS